MKSQRYYWITTNARHIMRATEEELLENERRVSLTVDHVPKHLFDFPAWYLPGLAFRPEGGFWCGAAQESTPSNT